MISTLMFWFWQIFGLCQEEDSYKESKRIALNFLVLMYDSFQ